MSPFSHALDLCIFAYICVSNLAIFWASVLLKLMDNVYFLCASLHRVLFLSFVVHCTRVFTIVLGFICDLDVIFRLFSYYIFFFSGT